MKQLPWRIYKPTEKTYDTFEVAKRPEYSTEQNSPDEGLEPSTTGLKVLRSTKLS